MLKLDKYEQQIILACKGHSKLDIPMQEQVRNIISQMVKIKIELINNHSIYYWLLKLVKKLDDEFNIGYKENLLDSMFCSDWFFTKCSQQDSISIIEVNDKLISMIGFIKVKYNNEPLIELEIDDDILNNLHE